MEMVTKEQASTATKKQLLQPKGHSEVFEVLRKGTRKDVVRLVEEKDVTLGMVDPTSGRSLMYKLLTTVTNGDKIVLDKLDSCVTTSGEDQNDDDWGVVVNHRCLVDEDPRSMTIVNDLLNLPRKISIKVLGHPVIKTFIEKRWKRTRFLFLISFILYVLFVLLLSSFIYLMYQRDVHDIQTIKVQLPVKCDKLRPIGSNPKPKPRSDRITSRIGPLPEEDDPDLIDITAGAQTDWEGLSGILNTRLRSVTPTDDQTVTFTDLDVQEEEATTLELEVKKKKKIPKSRANKRLNLFAACYKTCWKKEGEKRICQKPEATMCAVEICLFLSIIILLILELWQLVALRKQYVSEMENWFEWVILLLAISTLGLKHDANVDTLKIVAALAICLAWIQLIFLFSRYPFLGGKFSIMYYSITKRIIKAAIGFLILLCAFTFSFYIIHFNQETESFETLFRSFIKVFVMTLGEFEFDDLWENSHQEGTEGYSQHFTMVLLVGLIIFGTISMVNLIIAIIITDIQGLQTVTKQQVLLHQAQHAVQVHALLALFKWLVRRKVGDSTPRDSVSTLNLDLCLHSVCKCGKERPSTDIKERLTEVLDRK